MIVYRNFTNEELLHEAEVKHHNGKLVPIALELKNRLESLIENGDIREEIKDLKLENTRLVKQIEKLMKDYEIE